MDFQNQQDIITYDNLRTAQIQRKINNTQKENLHVSSHCFNELLSGYKTMTARACAETCRHKGFFYRTMMGNIMEITGIKLNY